MSDLEQAARDFLALRRIAVVGVARGGDLPANLVFRKLRSAGYEVFPVNPNAESVEGVASYASVGAIPGGVEGAVVATHPAVAPSVVDDCAAAGVRTVWLHRSFGAGSVSDEAIERCRRHGLAAIPGGCPMMHRDPVDVGHKCIRFLCRVTGKLPEPIAARPGAAPVRPPGPGR
ncbi:MAG TPA: CoA-binding protein [Thermoanaerobaculia bacterium]|nr:CoA-binding protein [Thermoanaerobaculia bacterium]